MASFSLYEKKLWGSISSHNDQQWAVDFHFSENIKLVKDIQEPHYMENVFFQKSQMNNKEKCECKFPLAKVYGQEVSFAMNFQSRKIS